ncbi:DNA-binding transcriptional LysR family regulator [Paraburkholderia caballeronis]|uniref:LysR family transcriptional regulator n=1 Tax=Paraburkholderia caballeronis TaxID=416943 RepID=UPI001065BBD1|nr:LysR family transcriptional regulator [Paraburkholderia caballeronis]TDV25558.1 DNA-binding transcriptional LysR family regulator [Paraburkholderia caballeronis]
MSRNLDIGLVRAFVAVAESGSMTAAANALYVTQGAVSQQIKRLEASFGCSLFTRDARRIELSPVGERFLGQARQLLRLNDEILAEMNERPLHGPLRIGVPYDLMGPYFATIIKAFSDTHPHVEISLVCGTSPELADAIHGGTLDLAVVEEPAGVSADACLRVEPLVWVGARGGGAHRKRPLPLSMVAESCAFRPVVLAALDERGIRWRTVFESGGIEATTATVRSGLAITAWLASTVPADLDILGDDADLPPLPQFAIRLLLPAVGQPVAQEFARHVRTGLLRGA